MHLPSPDFTSHVPAASAEPMRAAEAAGRREPGGHGSRRRVRWWLRRRVRALRRQRPRGRAAFTLMEIMIAITLFAILGAAALQFFIKQSGAVMATAGRLDAQQNVSFALDAIDHDLRVAGVGLGVNQPMVIEAHANAVTFNADLVTRDTASVTAASYYDPSVPDSLALALTPARAITLPYSAVTYPDSLYLQTTGLISNAETISYWVTPDSTTTRPDDYLLLRRVNNGTPTVVARGLVLPGGVPVFQYFIPGATINSRVQLSAATLPLYFKAGVVGPDTLLAKISEVRVQLQAVYSDPVAGDVIRSASASVPLLNAGLQHAAACGQPPAAPVTITPTAWPAGDSIGVAWPASNDELAGQKDVKSYSIYRRTGGTGSWGTPVYTTPAQGTPNYAWEDKVVPIGAAYQYAVVARDCTPALSALVPAAATVSPNP